MMGSPKTFLLTRPRTLLAFLAIAMGFFYELGLAMVLGLTVGNTVLWIVLIVGVYALSVQAGSFWEAHSSPQRRVSHLMKNCLVLHLTGAASLTAVNLFYSGHAWLAVYWSFVPAIILFYSIVFFVTADMGVLSGKALAFLTIEFKDDSKNSPVDCGGLLLGLGSLVGALLFLKLSEFGDIWWLSLLLAGCNILILLLFLFVGRRAVARPRQYAFISAISLLLIAAALSRASDIQQLFLKDRYHNIFLTEGPWRFLSALHRYPRVERFFAGQDRIDLVRVPESMLEQEWPVVRAYTKKFEHRPDFPRGYMLYFNGRFIFRSDFEEIPNEYLTHIPMILNETIPNRVLVFDLGAGLVTRELVKHPGIAQIIQVSFSPKLTDLSQNHPLFRYFNAAAFKDPRVKVVVGDAFVFLEHNRQKYDAIYMDMPVPDNYRFSRYYSSDFFQRVKEHLTEDGYFAFQAPGAGHFAYFDENGHQDWSARNKWPQYADTLRDAGFRTVIPYVSALERNQKQAAGDLYALTESPDIEPQDHEDVVRRLTEEKMRTMIVQDSLLAYVYALQEGFIFAKVTDPFIMPTYKKLGVTYNILSFRRFNAAFAFDYPSRASVLPRRVNTRLRPYLPGGIWWNL